MDTAPPVRIAMWSGPRNISTAMMRSFGARPDTAVCDEPLYAHYLQETADRRHPGYEETLAAHDRDWRRVAEWLTGPVPGARAVFYQKQMAHHLLPSVGLDWLDGLSNCLLIRHPASVLLSLTEFFPDPTPSDTGLPQQLAILERIERQTGQPPVVVESRDVLTNPERMLSKLCDRLGIAFDAAMLQWEPGLRDTDGAWAPFWYRKVAETTGFAPYRPADVTLPDSLLPALEACQPMYDRLYSLRLQ
ncbi:MAG: HAD family hydrolase [Planctomycetota bacterium]